MTPETHYLEAQNRANQVTGFKCGWIAPLVYMGIQKHGETVYREAVNRDPEAFLHAVDTSAQLLADKWRWKPDTLSDAPTVKRLKLMGFHDIADSAQAYHRERRKAGNEESRKWLEVYRKTKGKNIYDLTTVIAINWVKELLWFRTNLEIRDILLSEVPRYREKHGGALKTEFLKHIRNALKGTRLQDYQSPMEITVA